MKGVILAGGTGSRLYPLTKIANKHTLPVYHKPMICYPIETLKEAGIDEILIISGPGHAGEFIELLGSGYDLGLTLNYTIQEKPLGIAHGIWIARQFADGEDIALILGDNIIQDSIKEDVKSFNDGAKLFVSPVEDSEGFGIANVVEGQITAIEEKPESPSSNLAVTGLYLYSNDVFERCEQVELSDGNELEVTDLNRIYLEHDELDYRVLDGYWFDTGTPDGLFQASEKIRELQQQGIDRGVNISETDWGQATKGIWEISEEDI